MPSINLNILPASTLKTISTDCQVLAGKAIRRSKVEDTPLSERSSLLALHDELFDAAKAAERVLSLRKLL